MPDAKRPKRAKPVGLQARITPEMDLRIDELMTRLQGRVKNAAGKPVTRTDMLVYWMTWLLRQSPDRQAQWAEVYREEFSAEVRGVPPAESGKLTSLPGADWSIDRKPDEQDKPPHDNRLPKRRRGK